MKTGNKPLARELVEKAFQEVKRIQLQRRNEAQTEEEKAAILCDPLQIFHQAIENGRPVLQLVPVKRGGVKYQVPVPITEHRSYFVSMRWLKEAGREKERTTHFPEKLARELLAAARNEVSCCRRRRRRRSRSRSRRRRSRRR
ncbi:28S ribosomal protein S7, mitochondrial [Portunus trituberculatus]|uniref:28S ribosomal protein S7, mitochondrial n=1 Tax=Portunus trituberculatus TaxID=210409 RepID=A0A5B7IVG7_PORTR|nr:28S ribosomal protein S7, mitochondrial [Portunus trituberculatus]